MRVQSKFIIQYPLAFCSFRPYWVDTGASTLAIDLAKDYQLERIISEDPLLSLRAVNTFDYTLLAQKGLRDAQVLALIYFTGYLTIKDGNTDFLTLTFPNTEVRKTFTQSLVELFTGIDISIFASRALVAIRTFNLDALVKTLNVYFKEFPYTILDKKEKGYQEAFYSFFLMIGGLRVTAEEPSLLGRSDVILSLSHDVYVIEMKVDSSAETAISQIKTLGYYDRYINTNKKIHIIGVNFNSQTRQIDNWKEEVVDKSLESTYLG